MLSLLPVSSGSSNKEFNFRHDWNSLISDDETLQVGRYSQEYFPKADDYVRTTVHVGGGGGCMCRKINQCMGLGMQKIAATRAG